MLDLLIDIPLSLAAYVGIVYGMRFLHPVHDRESQVKPEEPVSPLHERVAAEVPAQPQPLRIEPVQEERPSDRTVETVDEMVFGAHVPTDKVLERHFLQYLGMVFSTLYPAPLESVQKRHHHQLVGRKVLEVLASEAAYDALIDRYEALNHPPMPEISADAVVERSDVVSLDSESTLLKVSATEAVPVLHLPEDSVLRRHRIHQLVSDLESIFPRPTDSVLQRHYDQWLEAEWSRWVTG